jgi:hypothetical protein
MIVKPAVRWRTTPPCSARVSARSAARRDLDETAAYLAFGLAEVLAANGKAEIEGIMPHMFAAEEVFCTSEVPFIVCAARKGGQFRQISARSSRALQQPELSTFDHGRNG